MGRQEPTFGHQIEVSGVPTFVGSLWKALRGSLWIRYISTCDRTTHYPKIFATGEAPVPRISHPRNCHHNPILYCTHNLNPSNILSQAVFSILEPFFAADDTWNQTPFVQPPAAHPPAAQYAIVAPDETPGPSLQGPCASAPANASAPVTAERAEPQSVCHTAPPTLWRPVHRRGPVHLRESS